VTLYFSGYDANKARARDTAWIARERHGSAWHGAIVGGSYALPRTELVKPSKIEYPKLMRFTAEFAPEGLDVYEGPVAIIARFPKASIKGIRAIQGTVTAQACTNQICLPPSTLPISTAVAEK
jgi:hypothetical protein